MSKETLINKITLFKQYKKELENFLKKTDFVDQEYYVLERLFQLCVDEATDINSLLIEMNHESIPDYNQTTFSVLQKIGVLVKTDVQNISSSVGLRNRIIHRYEAIQRALMVKEIVRFLKLYDVYESEIITYCESLG